MKMEILMQHWKNNMKYFILAIIVLFSFSCSKKELLIEPILGDGIYNRKTYEYQYYTISNYKHLPKDSLLCALRDYVLKNTNTKITDLKDFGAFFYKKSMFAFYRIFLSDAVNSEMGWIDEYHDKFMAQIFYHKEKKDKYTTLISVLYNEEFVFPFKTVFSNSIALKRKDTLVNDSDKNIIYKIGSINATLE